MAVRNQDISSLSNHLVVFATHMDFNWHVDFEAETISGRVAVQLTTATADVDEVRLDSKGLDIRKVFVTIEDGPLEPVEKWSRSSDANDALGDGLVVPLPRKVSSTGVTVSVHVEYSTVPSTCLALCWLAAEQTESKTLPFMYSQCQAIHARTIVPCQDTPAVRTTYRASVTTSAKEATVLMSALADEVANAGTFSFHQPVPIASYLIAITVGNIAGKDISDRCRVYAEPTSVERAAWEFAEVEDILKVAESIAGPYEWGRYDLLVLPPSFPYGGMENPNLTFVTPTCITGDRSLVELVAHEICHSWSGNLIGIASWSDFWINEGFTTLLQRKISERMHSAAIADFESGTGVMALTEEVNLYGADHGFTALVPKFERNVDPDDAFSSIPYEKGFTLLKRLEALVGVEAFDKWLKDVYVPTFRRRSIASIDVRECYAAHFPEAAAKIDWEAEFYAPGMPRELPKLSTTVRDACNQVADDILAFDASTTPSSVQFPQLESIIADWQGRQHVAFLERFHEVLSARGEEASLQAPTLERIDQFTKYSGPYPNNEVAFSWYSLCLRSRGAYTAHMPSMEAFVRRVGRMKFVRPLFRAWCAFDLAAASTHFELCTRGYHAITRKVTQGDFAQAASKQPKS